MLLEERQCFQSLVYGTPFVYHSATESQYFCRRSDMATLPRLRVLFPQVNDILCDIFFSLKVLEYSISTPKLLSVKVQLSHKRYSNYYLVIKTSCSIAPLTNGPSTSLNDNLSNTNCSH